MEPLGQEGARQAANAQGRLLAGRYRLTGLLGRGGMGAVWQAHDEHLNREVAVKELRLPDPLDDTVRRTWIARLDREARAAARLKHPGIVTVYDRVSGDDGRPWIVMELVSGRSLADLLKTDGALPPRRVAHIGLQMLDALRTAHRAGITHRDIKPANVLLENDRVVLTDFGIAAVEGEVTLTASGAILGTPAYMAPEQVRGQDATPASDLWSLGATLYTAVEGHPPFQSASTGALFVAIATESPAPPVHAGPLEPMLRALLNRDPQQRPTADQLHAQLARLIQGQPLTQTTALLPPGQPPPPPHVLPRRLSRLREKKVIALCVVAAATLVCVLALSTALPGAKDGQANRGERPNRSEQSPQASAPETENHPKTGRLFFEELGPLPIAESTDLIEKDNGSAEVTVVLCSDISKCPHRVIDTVEAWFRAHPRVLYVTFGDYQCFTRAGCQVEVEATRLPISDARIFRSRNTTEPDTKDDLILEMTVSYST